jgi:hypothetical protein
MIASFLTAASLMVALGSSAGTLHAQRPDSAAHERAARLFLKRLAGDWAFEWRSRDGPGATGTRQYRVLPDSLRVVWDETYNNSRQIGHGVLWYHPRVQRFFYFGVYAPSMASMLLTGRFEPSGNAVTFDLLRLQNDSIPLNEALVRSRLRVSDADGHIWARWDNAWVVNFRRPRSVP